jgi:RNA polymerase sigma-70 factor (ECF subfamily)
VNVREARVRGSAQSEVERLYRREGDRLWRSVLFYCGDREIASEAVAEAFAQLLRRDSAVRDARAWVWRSAFKIAGGELKDRSRFAPLDREPTYELPEVSPILTSILPELPDKQRASIVLHYYMDHPIREVARIIGSTPAAVAVHLHRGRKRIAELLTEMGDED